MTSSTPSSSVAPGAAAKSSRRSYAHPQMPKWRPRRSRACSTTASGERRGSAGRRRDDAADDAAREQGSRAGEDTSESARRSVKSLLNKLTFERFDIIADALVQVASSSAESSSTSACSCASGAREGQARVDRQRVMLLSELVLEHVLYEPSMAPLYALLARVLHERLPHLAPGLAKPMASQQDEEGRCGGALFRSHLLSEVQGVFTEHWEPRGRSQAVEVMTSSTPATFFTDEYYVARRRTRHRLGVLRFAAELYKLGAFVPAPTIHSYVRTVLATTSRGAAEQVQALEGTIVLLRTAGQVLDESAPDGVSRQADVYFAKLEDVLLSSEHLPLRIRFMLMDLIDLRKNSWQHRPARAPQPQLIVPVNRHRGKRRGGRRYSGSTTPAQAK